MYQVSNQSKNQKKKNAHETCAAIAQQHCRQLSVSVQYAVPAMA